MVRNGVFGYRFGEFEVRLTGEMLLRKGVPLSIQRLPFQMLTLLLTEPGRVVPREEIRKCLWDDQDYLEFENGLHVAAAKLREALGERAAAPRYIKTISGKGYQFIGEAIVIPSAVSNTPLPAVLKPVLPAAVTAKAGKFWTWPVYAALLLAFVGAGLWVYKRQAVIPMDPGQRVLIGSLTNDTGNAELDGVFDVSFQLKLRESQYLNLEMLEAPRGPAPSVAPLSTAEQLANCVHNQAKFLLAGHLENHNPGYRLILKAWRCDNGHQIASETQDASTQMSIASALDLGVQELRRRLGEPDTMLRRANAPVSQVTTRSMAALRAFAMGEAKRTPATVNEAISYYKIAIDLDPEFAMAYARLGASYSWREDDELSKQAFTTAFRLRAKTTDRERLYIASHYYANVTGEIPQAIQTYKLWATIFPYDVDPKNGLAGIYNNVVGQPDKALEQANAAVALRPNDVADNLNLAVAHLGIGDYAYLNRQCKTPGFPGAGASTFDGLCYVSYFAQGDEQGMKREIDHASKPLQMESTFTHVARVAASRGHVMEARALFQKTRQQASDHQMSDYAAEVVMEQAAVESELGFKKDARRDALAAVNLAPLDPSIRGFGALVLARSEDRSGAIELSSAASAQAPLDSVLQTAILEAMRGVLALDAGDAKAALESLEISRPYDFNALTISAPAYYRGLAYEKDGNWKAAAKEFQSNLAHHSIMVDSLFVPLAKLELGHSLMEAGESDRANVIFSELDLLWEQADKDFSPKMRLKSYRQQLKAKS